MRDPTAALDAMEARLKAVESHPTVADVIAWATLDARLDLAALIAIVRAAEDIVTLAAEDHDAHCQECLSDTACDVGEALEGWDAALASLAETGEAG